ncbi:DUF4032 domain-containing protein [Parenemella sanctibonifatiensis]|uniref:Lipopolysaccharide kinase n=1 Tax=Parenemella sanctibonifatiensis TaxID=2016505 RepID=A0A255ELR4_9ACTN|nr:DUF4032 domain-containing protein [Parenemella sanctibonifatiensis]OYN92489.1 lipopolysaccharide kinase [Parenemella sanctibonifatiensis]
MPRFLSAKPDGRLIPLPWDVPLADWPTDHLVALPRGISRHVVRFIKLGTSVYAAKEILDSVAVREYRLLQDLHRLQTPSVEPVAVVTSRRDRDGNPLDSVLITRHLQFSLPYRSLFAPGVRQDTVTRLIDALVVLLAKLHLVGFLWGDVSLSNSLFRRDASEFAAYLVDAETGELHPTLSTGQREHDLEIARVNLFGEFSDLEAGGLLDESLDPLALVQLIEARYRELWSELTDVEEFAGSELHRLESRVRRLNALGFDVAELDIRTTEDGKKIRIQPKVVDAGHHSRRLMRLTGLDAEENQARRLLNDLDSYRARTNQRNADEAIVAHQWVTQIFEPVLAAVPEDLRGKRDPGQLFHEVLEHRWFRSQEEHRELSMLEATESYIDLVLRQLPDERLSQDALTVVGGEERRLANPYDPSMGFADDHADKPYDPWEDGEAESPPTPASDFLDIDALRAKAKK